MGQYSEANKKNYAKHKETILNRQLEYREAHREELKIKARLYYAAHAGHYVTNHEYGCHLTNEQIAIGRE